MRICPEERMLHVYTGDGKGKTTAALGLALRAVGHGMRARVIQFMKADARTGELASARELEGLEIIQSGAGFVAGEPCEEDRLAAKEAMRLARESVGRFDLLVLDEVNCAARKGLVDVEELVELAESAGVTELVFTGRGADARLVERADYVTEMRKVKHPHDRGVGARKGVEY